MFRASRFVPLLLLVAVVAVLFAGCGGGGDDQARVGAGLQTYLGIVAPEESGLPTGSGPPRVADRSCRDRHVKTGNSIGLALFNLNVPSSSRNPELTLWSCVVRVRNVALPMDVVVNDRTRVVWASGKQTPARFRARTYNNK
jgi:hypothetical protein